MSVPQRHSKNYDYLFKVILIGDSGVGKTSLLAQFIGDEIVQSHISTIGIDFKMKCLVMDEKQVKIQIWDTAGQERYETITTQYYRRANGIILAYDVTRRDSFDNVRKWLRYVEEFADKNVKVILLGNKCDLKDARKVSKEEGQELMEEIKIPWFETSAYTGENVEDAFLMITKEIYVDTIQNEENARIKEVSRNLTVLNQEEVEESREKCSC